ncbi:MAG: HlyD family efflux transporter periplasmic adaptor subunit [Gammaproteobacteria bacterium]|nr:HlyD family efflux transporter periplasmic adaptor subunit [Gammaproteobacteria bacterium]MDH4253459.1 HlyD family efflux transporter periplasmic adaptor subunit [Gammaproteobacteria bacterium]MDH5309179.1 HlyD family efflux transporter periplasmic adaptor subunit [Gammaproteobacteria bacterium]
MRQATWIIGMAVLAGGCGAGGNEDRYVGQLESDRIELAAEFAEPLVERLLPEGASVSAGQHILRLDDRRASARLAEAEAALAQSRARLDELVRGPRAELIEAERANVAGAREDVEFRRIEWERAVQVYERALGSPESRDRARAALDAALAALAFREARLAELLSGTTVEELRQAEQAVRQQEARLDALALDAARHVVTAPVDGVLDSLPFELGERPAVGQPVAVLLAGTQAHARVYVPESLRVRISPGAAARVFVDGLDRPVDGKVRWVASEAAFTPYFALTEHDRGRLSFHAKIDLVGIDRRLPDGVPVEVEFPGLAGTH